MEMIAYANFSHMQVAHAIPPKIFILIVVLGIEMYCTRNLIRMKYRPVEQR